MIFCVCRAGIPHSDVTVTSRYSCGTSLPSVEVFIGGGLKFMQQELAKCYKAGSSHTGPLVDKTSTADPWMKCLQFFLSVYVCLAPLLSKGKKIPLSCLLQMDWRALRVRSFSFSSWFILLPSPLKNIRSRSVFYSRKGLWTGLVGGGWGHLLKPFLTNPSRKQKKKKKREFHGKYAAVIDSIKGSW